MLDNSYHIAPEKANQSYKAKPRQLAAVSLSRRYGISLHYARLVADLNGFGRAAYE